MDLNDPPTAVGGIDRLLKAEKARLRESAKKEAVMKISKSARRANRSANQSPVSLPDALRNIIEIVRAEGDDASLIALMLPSAALASLSREKRGYQLPVKDRLWLHILDLLYDYDLMPESVLEAVHLMLTHGANFDEERGERMLGLLKEAFYPDEEMRKESVSLNETERKRIEAAQRKAKRAVALARLRRSRGTSRVIKSEDRK
jgi:hypothetical protein